MTAPEVAYGVRFGPMPDLALLETRWTALEARSDCSIFLSWFWIGAWLGHLCPMHTARLATVEQGGRCVAMGVFTLRRRFPGFGPRHLRLHETGNAELDSITVEYNGLVSEQGHEREALAAVVRYLADRGGWLTLHLPGIDAEAIEPEALRLPGIQARHLSRPTHFVDLADLARRGQDYMASISGATRANVRRTGRKITALAGDFGIEVAGSSDQRREFFSELVNLHQARWGGRDGAGGAFADAQVVRFHHGLIASSTASSGVMLMRVRAGPETVGFVYGLVWRGVVYFYQAGIDYRRFGSCGSVGLFILAHCVQHAMDTGMARFELMAGDAPYKQTLGTSQGRMLWLSLDRQGLAARARGLWWALRRGRG